MRLVIDKFKVLTNKKIKKPVKVVLISDVHFGADPIKTGKFNVKSMMAGIKKIENVDMFVLCGDFVSAAKVLKVARVRKNMTEMLTELGKQAKVVMVRGNHDYYYNTPETEQIYQDFGKIKNVILLDNAQKEIDGIKVTGFSPRKEAYDLIKHGKRSHKMTIKDFREKKFSFDEKEFNLILTHSPYSLTNKRAMREVTEVYEKCDLVMSGHLHNGLVASGNSGVLKKIFDGKKFVDYGFWIDPKTGFVSRHCRGAKLVGEGKISRTVLPSSKEYVEIDLRKNGNKNKLIQVTGKGVNKFSVIPIIAGRPSVVEVIIANE